MGTLFHVLRSGAPAVLTRTAKSLNLTPEASRFGHVVEAARFDVRLIHDSAAPRAALTDH